MMRDFTIGPLVFKTLYGWQQVHPWPSVEWTRYLSRLSLGRLSLHIFWRGDADQECHDHPWDFWTFPLVTYQEAYPDGSINEVRRFRLHMRRAEYAHRVLDRADRKRIVTIIWKSKKRREWGFFCPGGWRHWTDFVNRGCDE